MIDDRRAAGPRRFQNLEEQQPERDNQQNIAERDVPDAHPTAG